MHTTEQLSTALAGRYAIERKLGEGGVATVYLARDIKHDRKVALKVLKPELGAVLGVERFLSEIKVTANLQHPNLLPLFDSGEALGLLFYVMPFVEGESLRARLDREQQLPVDEAVRIASAIASALAYAHERGVIHRDLKPENILLQSGQPVVADFGIALAVSNAGGARITQTGLSLGTPQYMSPEQATGDRAIDARSDIYSLAAMTYEMIAGEPPHTGPNAQAIMAKLLTAEPAPLSLVRKSAPVHVELAVAKGLANVPADRFAAAADFAAALDGSMAVTFPAGTARGTAAMAARPARGRAREVVAWAVAAVAIAAAIWMRPRAEQPRVSPEGKRVSVRVGAADFNDGDVWVYEFAGGALSRLTSDNNSYRASWTRDDAAVPWIARSGNAPLACRRPWDGSAPASAMIDSTDVAEYEEGPPGGWPAARTWKARDIAIIPRDSVRAGQRLPLTRLTSTPANETAVALSPSGAFVAYQSDETGDLEVYVQPVPGAGKRLTVSVGGGLHPRWSPDGKTLYYVGRGHLMAAQLAPGAELGVVRRDSLFAMAGDAAGVERPYDVMPNGREFVVVRSKGSQSQNPLRTTLLLDWQSLFAPPAGRTS